MKKILFLFVTAVFLMIGSAGTNAQGSVKRINGVIKNSADRAVVFGSIANDPTPPGGTITLKVNQGENMIPILFANQAGNALDTVTVKVNFHRDGDVFELTTGHLGRFNNSKPALTVTADRNTGKTVSNQLDGILFFLDRGICLSPGTSSQELIDLSPNERIVIEKNYRLFFLEISDFFAKNDKTYAVSQETLLQGSGRDSIMVSLIADGSDYVFIDDQTREVKGIKSSKGRGGYQKNFVEGANTILMQTLMNGVAQTRYYTFMASKGNTTVSPPANAFDNPPLYYGRRIKLPLAGFDKSCSFEIFDPVSKTWLNEVIIDENGSVNAQTCFLGMNRVRVSYFEKTPQGRIRYSFEYFKLISETDSVFKIDPNYFWLLAGKPVPVILKNSAKNILFQQIELWSLNQQLNPRNIVIKRDYPTEKTYVREGIARLPGRYTEGLTIRNLTVSFIVSSQDKNKPIEIRDENIDRTQR